MLGDSAGLAVSALFIVLSDEQLNLFDNPFLKSLAMYQLDLSFVFSAMTQFLSVKENLNDKKPL